MKKLLVLLSVVLAGQSLFAQSNILFEETFSNGLAGDGLNGAWVTAGSSLQSKWEYRGTTTTPNLSVGSQGAYAGTLGPIVSNTAANGFFIFDSDYLDNGGVVGNFGFGNAPTPHTSGLTSPVIVRPSGTSWSKITFHSYARRYIADMMILFSTNGGITWSDTLSVYDMNSLGINVATDDDNFEILNIPSNLQLADSLKVRFYFDGATNMSTGNYGYYFWMIDDVRLLGGSPNDLTLDSIKVAGDFLDNSSHYMAQIPSFLAQNDAITYTGYYTNSGSNTATNTHFYQSVTGPLLTNMNYSMDTTLNSGDTIGVNLSTPFTFSQGLGNYNYFFGVESDSVDDYMLDNYSDTFTTEVTDSVLTYTQNATGNLWYGAGTYYEVGNRYSLPDSVYATSISVEFGDLTSVNSIVRASIYSYPAGTSLVSSAFYFISQAEINSQKVFSIAPTILSPGQYIVAFETFTDSVMFKRDEDFSEDTVGIFMDNGSLYTVPYAFPIALNIHPVNSCNSFVAAQVQSDSCGANSGSIDLTVGGGSGNYSYAWSNGASTSAISNLSGGTYHYTVTDTASCSFSDSVTVSTIHAFSVSINQDAQPLCVGDSSGVLSINGFTSSYSFLWNNGSTDTLISNVSAGNYQVTVTDSLGCMVVDSFALVNQPYLGVQLPSDTALCLNQGAVINVNPNSATSWVWSDASSGMSLAINASQNNTQTIWVAGTDIVTGCASSDTMVIARFADNPVSIMASDSNFCFGDSVNLSVGSVNGSLLWSTGNIGSSIMVSNSSTVSVVQTDSNGCESTDSISVVENSEIFVAMNQVSNNTCSYDTDGVLSVSVSGGTPGYQYTWSSSDTTSQISGLANGSYSISVTDAFGCVKESNATITSLSTLQVNIDSMYSFCQNESAVINAGSGASQWNWSTGDTMNQISIETDVPGSVSLWVSGLDTYGCMSSDSSEVNIYPIPMVDLGNDTVILGMTNTINLNAGSGFASYLWSTGANGETILVDTNGAGVIWVEVTNSYGCASRDSIVVDFISSVRENELFSLSMYPNPTSDYIRITGVYGNQRSQLIVVNVNGQVVKTYPVKPSNGNVDMKLDVSNLAPGVYQLGVYSSNNVVFKPFVIDR